MGNSENIYDSTKWSTHKIIIIKIDLIRLLILERYLYLFSSFLFLEPTTHICQESILPLSSSDRNKDFQKKNS